MKKLFCSLALVAFVASLQAGETKQTTVASTKKADKTAACTDKTAMQAKTDGKSSCCSGGACDKTPSRLALLSPKAASEVAKR